MSKGIEIKSRDELRKMRASGLILIRALETMRAAVEPGMTTYDVDAIGSKVITEAGAISNFKGYHGFTGTICSSVNDEVVHGIPSPSKVLADGDLISIDCGCIVDGWHSDSAISFHVGGSAPTAEVGLIQAATDSMWAGIAAMRAGGKMGDVTSAIEGSVKASVRRDGRGYGEVAGYGGHGIGSAMHMDPFLPNFGRQGKGLKLVAGMALAIEPMLTLGTGVTKELDDGWTVVTKDGSRAAHVEHSVAILDDGISVLTAADAGAAMLAPYGITPISLD
ncbi:type I methionyl aminopeptidase [Nakamurella antarctica]|uniref:Methionine aminopeptidase n=1 Tax=Nakamurella antarctica TaxID=1902245 RepID=A0A3G8ZXC4_9ACTN|nr:type I methionyl aminopeptidase [Nakamurella antarctica]AZI58676.1 type I methionyl aminopeptidase [Nakamurella antarctica]